MSRPGTTIIRSDTPPPRSAPTDTGPWFVVGLSQKGAATDAAIPVKSLTDFVARFGTRTAAPFLYDAAETFFREGGASMLVSRVLGPAAANATVTLLDASAGNALVVSAVSPGDWANGAAGGLTVQVVAGGAGGTFVLVIALGGVEVERSPDLADVAAAVIWGQSSSYVRIALGGSALDPAVVAATNLAGGTDDRASATDAHWLTALDRFVKSLGPGQVSAPGGTTAARHAQLLNHAQANNRTAILDAVDSGTKATLLAIEAAISANANAKRYGGLFAPWVVIEGVTAGTTRTIPPSPVVAGLMAKRDGEGRTPNEPAAGSLGESLTALRLSQANFSDIDRTALNEGQVNLLRDIYGGIRVYGYRTLTDPVTDENWINLGNARLFMAITGRGEAIAERFVFRQLDGRRQTISEYGGALIGMLLPFWEDGSLFGDTPESAFYVDVGLGVNTDETMADGDLRAVVALRVSAFAEEVILELVKTRTTEAVA